MMIDHLERDDDEMFRFGVVFFGISRHSGIPA